MFSRTTASELFSAEKKYRRLPSELELFLQEGKPSDDNSAIRNFLVEYFNDDKDVQCLIDKYDGNISGIISQLDRLGVSDEKISFLCRKILDIQKGKLPIYSSSPFMDPLVLEFICDLDVQDKNGGLLGCFNRAIACRSLVITTRTLFRAAHFDGKSADTINERDRIMNIIKVCYDIYSDGAYLVLTPKRMGEQLSIQEKLERLDLDSKNLNKITLQEAWLQSDQQSTMSGFQNLFADEPKYDKFIYIAGHGGGENLAGLTVDHYNEFLKWGKKQRCQGLLVTSCNAGGKNSLLHLPKINSNESVAFQHRFLNGVSFPVFLRSIGDFSTSSGHNVEENAGHFFCRLIDLFNSPGGRTLFQLRKMLQEEEKGKPEKPLSNLVQVYFPHSSDSPGGFRPVGEGGNSYSLTYVKYRQSVSYPICNRKEGIPAASSTLRHQQAKLLIFDKKFLELSPGFIECPIEFRGENPVILSMIPGQAHHLLNELVLDGIGISDFLFKNCIFYRNGNIGVVKAFFISKIRSGDEELNQLFMEMKSGKCGYKKGNKYYLWNINREGDPIEVEPLQFLLRWNGTIEATKPDAQAIRAATGGQQDGMELINSLKQEAFWGTDDNLQHKFLNLEKMKTVFPSDLQELIAHWVLKDGEKITLTCYLLRHNETAACALFKLWKLSPEGVDERGVPLLIHASRNNNIEFIKLLIEKKVDINTLDPETCNTPARIALDNGHHKMFELLLAQDNINLVIKNRQFEPVFTPALSNLEIFKKCLNINPNLNLNTIFPSAGEKSYSLLGKAINYRSLEVLGFLLENGADPDGIGGEYSPLVMAIIAGDREAISLLLKYGASPYIKDGGGHLPILEAIYRSSLQVVEQLLKKQIPEMSQKEKRMLIEEIFLIAIESGEEEKINLVFQMNPFITEELGCFRLNLLQNGLSRLSLFGNNQLVEKITNICIQNRKKININK